MITLFVLAKNINYVTIDLKFSNQEKGHSMKKYIMITMLSLCTSAYTMEQQTLRFENWTILIKKLTTHDTINKNDYAQLAKKSGFHVILGDKELPHYKVSNLIDFCLELYNPNMSTNEVHTHRNRIVTILSEENSKL